KAYQANYDANLFSPNPRIPANAKEQTRAEPRRLHIPTVFSTQPSDTMVTNTQPQPSTTDYSTTGNDIEMVDIVKEDRDPSSIDRRSTILRPMRMTLFDPQGLNMDN
ncbi:hypothetical protein SARC_13022, partial [Sphaeroforma arctica JP610]